MSANGKLALWETLLSTLKQKGCVFDGLFLQGPEENKSLYTAKSLKKGETIAVVKKQTIFDCNNIQLDLYPKEAGALSPKLKLALRLIEEINTGQSKLQSYIDTLQYCGPLPWFSMNCEKDDYLKALGISSLVEKLSAGVESLLEIFINSPTKTQLDVDAFLIQWAYSVVLSRSFVTSKGDSVLVPLCDLMNHTNEYNTSVYDDEQGNFYIVAEKDIQKNEELTRSYGQLDNTWLFLLYGFTLENNPYTCVTMCMDIFDSGGNPDAIFAIGDYAHAQGYPRRYDMPQAMDLIPLDSPKTPVLDEEFRLMTMSKIANENLKHHVLKIKGSYSGLFEKDIKIIANDQLINIANLAIFCKICFDSLEADELLDELYDEPFNPFSTAYINRLSSLLKG